jgi:formylglycine-generating enzyme required for sulfatase activity
MGLWAMQLRSAIFAGAACALFFAFVSASLGKERPGETPLSAAELSELKPGDSFRECTGCPMMVIIPAGEVRVFWPAVKEDAPFFRIDVGDQPPDPVSVPAFAIGRVEVTLGEWRACVRADACRLLPKIADAPDTMPASGVTFADAEAFVGWLNTTAGPGYALPPRLQWERAAKGGKDDFVWWGDGLPQGRAHCGDCGSAFSPAGPAPVGSFPPNAFGVHDTVGNVAEWLTDCRVRAGQPDCRVREIAGGHFSRSLTASAATFGTILAASERPDWVGFRVMRKLSGP